MATQLVPTSPAGPSGFANPIAQARGLLSQPAVKRALPMMFMIGLIVAAAFAWSALRTPPQKVLFPGLGDADKAAVMQALDIANIDNAVDDTGSVTVGEDDYHRARLLLAGQDLPKAAPGGYALLDQLPMGVSRVVEGERVKQARETEIARSIQEIDAVAEARVHLATPESTVFVRDRAAPTASVVVKLQPGRALSDAQVRSIVNLVASSVPGMKPDAVTIVDQMGTLLSNGDGSGGGITEGDKRLAMQRQVEEKVRTQIAQLLTPLIGAGNFTAEVQADVNLDETQATRETYEKQGTVRAEQGSWTGNQPGAGTAPGGIPGALSNTAPAASTLATPATGGAQPPAAGTPQTTPAGPVTDALKQSDSFARAYDTGKEISVSRSAPGELKRLSVAVLLREPEKGRRTALEIQQITQLVQAAVGFNPQRQDQVQVISKKFTGATDAAADVPSWYQAEWVPMVLRNATALIIALLVLFLGVRPMAKALMKKRDDTPSGAKLAFANPGADPSEPGAPFDGSAPVSIEMLDGARGYDDRVGLVRGFTRENPARAALAVRDMIRSGDGQ